MTNDEILQTRALLTALDRLGGGLGAEALGAHVETATGRTLTTAERDLMLARAVERRYATTYRNAITDRVCYAITDEGRIALSGLGPLS